MGSVNRDRGGESWDVVFVHATINGAEVNDNWLLQERNPFSRRSMEKRNRKRTLGVSTLTMHSSSHKPFFMKHLRAFPLALFPQSASYAHLLVLAAGSFSSEFAVDIIGFVRLAASPSSPPPHSLPTDYTDEVNE